jgi:hypothetical protein
MQACVVIIACVQDTGGIQDVCLAGTTLSRTSSEADEGDVRQWTIHESLRRSSLGQNDV